MDICTVNVLEQDTQKISVQDWLNENDFTEASCGFEPLVVFADVHHFSPHGSRSSQSDVDEDFLSVSQQLRKKSARHLEKKLQTKFINFDAIEPYEENMSGDKSTDESYTFDKIFYSGKKTKNVIKKTYAGKVRNKIKNDKRVLSSYRDLFLSKSTNSNNNSVNSSRKRCEFLGTGNSQRPTKDKTTNKSILLGKQLGRTSVINKSKHIDEDMSFKDETVNINKTFRSDSDKLIDRTLSAEGKGDVENISLKCIKDCYVNVHKFDPKLYKVNINNNVLYSIPPSRESLQENNFTICKPAEGLSHTYFVNIIKNNPVVLVEKTSRELLQKKEVNSFNYKPADGLSPTYFENIIKNNPVVVLEKLEKSIVDDCTYPLNNFIQSSDTSGQALHNYSCKDIANNLQTANKKTRKKVEKTVNKSGMRKRQVKNFYLNSTEKLVIENCEQGCKRNKELSELKFKSKDTRKISIHNLEQLQPEIEINEKFNNITHKKILNTFDQLSIHGNMLDEENGRIETNRVFKTKNNKKSKIKKNRLSFGNEECNTVSDQENITNKRVQVEELDANVIRKLPVVLVERFTPHVIKDRSPLINKLNNSIVSKEHNVSNNSYLSSTEKYDLVKCSLKQEKNIKVTPVKVSEQMSPGWSRLESTKKDFNLSHRIKLNIGIKLSNKAENSSTETIKQLQVSKSIVKNLFCNKEKKPQPNSITELDREKNIKEIADDFNEPEKHLSVSRRVATECIIQGKETANLKRNLVDTNVYNYRNDESEKTNSKKPKLSTETKRGHHSTLLNEESIQKSIQRSVSTMTMIHMVDVGIQTCLEPPCCLHCLHNESITTSCNSIKSITIEDSDAIKSSSKPQTRFEKDIVKLVPSGSMLSD